MMQNVNPYAYKISKHVSLSHTGLESDRCKGQHFFPVICDCQGGQ